MNKLKVLEQMKENLKELERMGFDKYQIDEIYNGLKSDIDINDINKYADLNFNENETNIIREGLEEGIDILKYANPMFNENTLEEISYDLKAHKEIENKSPELEI